MVTYDCLINTSVCIRQKIYTFVLANLFVARLKGNEILKIGIIIVIYGSFLLNLCVLVLIRIDCDCCHSASEECYSEYSSYNTDCIFICEFFL